MTKAARSGHVGPKSERQPQFGVPIISDGWRLRKQDCVASLVYNQNKKDC